MTRTSLALRFPIHPGLAETTRLPERVRPGALSSAELAVLLGLGAVAAAGTMLLDFRLRLPGHAILRATLPMALGLALVPRKRAGISMSAGALLSVLILALSGCRLTGGGAMTSLLLTGPLLDWTLQRARTGGQIYAGFALAGLVSNTCAFVARATPKLLGWDPAGTRSLSSWLLVALLSYTLFGLAAGLLSGWIGFRLAPRDVADPQQGPPT
jgi:hypothetical protein